MFIFGIEQKFCVIDVISRYEPVEKLLRGLYVRNTSVKSCKTLKKGIELFISWIGQRFCVTNVISRSEPSKTLK